MQTAGDPVALQREHVPCNLCGQDNAAVKYRVDTTRLQLSGVWIHGVERRVAGTETIVACRNCGLIYVNPRLAPMPGLAPYSVEAEMGYFAHTRRARRRAYGELLRQIPAWLGREPENLLDVGCGDGLLVEIARQHGIHSVGSEVSEALIRLVRERLGVDAVWHVDAEQLRQSQFDVAVLSNVIEHLRDPAQTLQEICRQLQPGGILLVHTPNVNGVSARLAGARWRQIEPFAHFYYFSARTLGRLLRKTGFEPCGRFSLVVAEGVKGALQRALTRAGIYVDNGLGMVARRQAG